MKEQNFANHKRLVAGYHYFTFSLALILLVLSIYSVFDAFERETGVLMPVMFILISFLIILMFFYARIFALKAQDRAIRSEENFRHFMLTGKIFDSKINLPQILALRFAPDDEFIELVKKAVTDNLSPVDIKKAIKNWKGDYYRV